MPGHLAEPSLYDSSSDLASAGGERLVLRDMLLSFERNLILTVLLAADGNQKRAAEALGVLPTTFQEKLKRFGLVNQRPGRHARSGERRAAPGDSNGLLQEVHHPPQEKPRK